MTADFTIIPAALADADAIAAIYAPYVLHGTATWEIDPPDAREMAARMNKVLGRGWPWLVARSGNGEVLGFAYSGQLGERAGYRFSCENSIYLRSDRRGQGIGTALLAELIRASEACGFRQMIALIAGTEPGSVSLHAKAGFQPAGHLKSAGRKRGQWIDLLYMQRPLGPGDTAPPPEEPT